MTKLIQFDKVPSGFGVPRHAKRLAHREKRLLFIVYHLPFSFAMRYAICYSDKKPILFGKLYHFRNTCRMNNFLSGPRFIGPHSDLGGLLHVFR